MNAVRHPKHNLNNLATTMIVGIVGAGIILEVYLCRYIQTSYNYMSFRSPPVLNKNKSAVSFKLWRSPKNIFFNITGNGAYAYNPIKEFCQKRKCVIPLVIGGPVSFTLIRNSKAFFYDEYELPNNQFYCSSSDWETRYCRAKDVCFVGGMYTVTSPYSIDFNNKMVLLGSKTLPDDFSVGRLENRFKYQYEIPKGIPFMKNKSLLFTIFYHMEMEWHQYFDFLIPTYLSLKRNGKFSKDVHLYIPYISCESVPPAIIALSNYNVECLARPFCFEDAEFGLVKMTSHKSDQTVIYDFPDVSIQEFREIYFDFFNLPDKKPETKRKPNILMVSRNLSRRIINEKEVLEAIGEIVPHDSLKLLDFSKLSQKDIIKELKNTDIFVGAHGSALSNMIWMKEGSIIIEIFPYRFTCRDWYQKAAGLSRVKYISYYPVSEEEAPDEQDDLLRKCFDGVLECTNILCTDRLRDQNIRVDINSFKQNIAPRLK